jgi:hypothetical protein
MTIKAAYIVTDMDMVLSSDLNCDALEFKTERAALKDATQRLEDSQGADAEVWVWRLSHVLMKPQTDPVIERVK